MTLDERRMPQPVTLTNFERYLARNREFWSAFAPPPDSSPGPDPARAILVDLMSAHFNYRVGNAVIGKYLQRRTGARLIALLNAGATPEQIALAESFGFDDILIDGAEPLPAITLDLGGDLADPDPRVARKALLEFRYDGVRLGDLTYDTYLRETGMGTVEVVDQDILSRLELTVRKFVGFCGLVRARNIVATVQGHTVYSYFGALARAAVHCGAAVYGRKFASGPLTIRRYTDLDDLHNHEFRVMRSEFEHAWQRHRAAFCDHARRYIEDRFAGATINGERGNHEAYGAHKQRYDSQSLRGMLGLDPHKPTACIMSHVFPDAPHSFPRMLYHDYYQWLIETLEIVKDIPGVNWLVKPHPDNKHYNAQHCAERAAQKYIERYPHIRLVPDAVNTASLFGILDAIVTVSGTAGLEFSARGIPAILAGESLYSGLGFTHEPRSIAEYAQMLSAVGTLGRLSEEETERALVAVHMLFMHLRVACAFLPPMPAVFWEQPDLEQVYVEATAALERTLVEDDPLYRQFAIQFATQATHLANPDPIPLAAAVPANPGSVHHG